MPPRTATRRDKRQEDREARHRQAGSRAEAMPALPCRAKEIDEREQRGDSREVQQYQVRRVKIISECRYDQKKCAGCTFPEKGDIRGPPARMQAGKRGRKIPVDPDHEWQTRAPCKPGTKASRRTEQDKQSEDATESRP